MRTADFLFIKVQQDKIPIFKDHCYRLAQGMVVKGLLERQYDIPPKPVMEDKMLDVPESKWEELRGVPYRDPNTHLHNPTILPDRLLNTLTPIFMIRHPAK